MTFEPNRYYFRSGMGGTLYVLNWDSPFTVTFYLRTPVRTSGQLTVSLLEHAPMLPYGMTGTTGPWHYWGMDERILAYPSPDALDLATVILSHERGRPPIQTLNGGLPWPVDKRDFGV